MTRPVPDVLPRLRGYAAMFAESGNVNAAAMMEAAANEIENLRLMLAPPLCDQCDSYSTFGAQGGWCESMNGWCTNERSAKGQCGPHGRFFKEREE